MDIKDIFSSLDSDLINRIVRSSYYAGAYDVGCKGNPQDLLDRLEDCRQSLKRLKELLDCLYPYDLQSVYDMGFYEIDYAVNIILEYKIICNLLNAKLGD